MIDFIYKTKKTLSKGIKHNLLNNIGINIEINI